MGGGGVGRAGGRVGGDEGLIEALENEDVGVGVGGGFVEAAGFEEEAAFGCLCYQRAPPRIPIRQDRRMWASEWC